MADPKQIYRFLLKLYPARFREEYEAPLERQFRDEYGQARGPWARVFFWLRALADLATSIPAEFARALRQDLTYAARVYRRRALATALAVAALALAILRAWWTCFAATMRISRTAEESVNATPYSRFPVMPGWVRFADVTTATLSSAT